MNYWDRKMKGAPAQQPRAIPPMTPAVRTPPSRDISTPVTQPTRPHIPDETVCPDCGSANYGGPKGSIKSRCFDCGYGNSYPNSTQGMPNTPSEGPVQAAKQVPTGGYHPETIVGKA